MEFLQQLLSKSIAMEARTISESLPAATDLK
jgi:hypothetical protein